MRQNLDIIPWELTVFEVFKILYIGRIWKKVYFDVWGSCNWDEGCVLKRKA